MQRLRNSPSGRLVPIDNGNVAFEPSPLPDEISLDADTLLTLEAASRAVGMLDGAGETIPSPQLLIRPLFRREAVLSSRIEGTLSSISDVLANEAGPPPRSGSDVAEVINYVTALEYGIDRLTRLPISFRLTNELHERLMAGVRGEETRPGQFRDTQVYIASPGASIFAARYVPPPPERVRDLFQQLEGFINRRESRLPNLARCALMHYQFEAIHPYRDGNGRTGRLLITLFLQESGLLSQPLLHLSAYFERDRQRYYDELLNVSATGDYARWVRYFLEGVEIEARDTITRIRRIRELQESWRDLLGSRGESANGLRLLTEICARPIISAPMATEFLGISDAGARRVLDRLVEAGILRRAAGGRPRLYIADRVIEELERPLPLP